MRSYLFSGNTSVRYLSTKSETESSDRLKERHCIVSAAATQHSQVNSNSAAM